jgi:hypothetical protein
VSPTPPGHAGDSEAAVICAKEAARPVRRNLNDRRAGTLQIRRVIEIADQHIALHQRSLSDRHNGNSVRVHIAIRRNGGYHEILVAQRTEEGRAGPRYCEQKNSY